MCLSMQAQLQLMCIQAMLVNNQLCSDSDKQYDPLKTIFKFKYSMSHTVCDLVRFNHYHKYLQFWLVDIVPVGIDCDVIVFV